MNLLIKITLCILLNCIYITRWYTVHTISSWHLYLFIAELTVQETIFGDKMCQFKPLCWHFCAQANLKRYTYLAKRKFQTLLLLRWQGCKCEESRFVSCFAEIFCCSSFWFEGFVLKYHCRKRVLFVKLNMLNRCCKTYMLNRCFSIWSISLTCTNTG